MDCSLRSVSNNLKKQRLIGNVIELKIPGQKRKTKKRDDRIMVRKSKSNRSKTAPENKAEMQIEHGESVSTSTTQRRLREAGPNGRTPRYSLHHE